MSSLMLLNQKEITLIRSEHIFCTRRHYISTLVDIFLPCLLVWLIAIGNYFDSSPSQIVSLALELVNWMLFSIQVGVSMLYHYLPFIGIDVFKNFKK